VEVGGGGGDFHIGEGTHFWGCIAEFWSCLYLEVDARRDLKLSRSVAITSNRLIPGPRSLC
jgi:hypothetical protein